MPWYFYSFISSLSFAGMILCVRRLQDLGFSSKQILLFLAGFSFFGFALLNLISPGILWGSSDVWKFVFVMLFAGAFAVCGNWADFEGIRRAKNPGYAVAIRNTTILPVVFLSVLFFNSSLGTVELLAVVLILFGIYLLVFKRTSEEKHSISEKGVHWYYFPFIALIAFTGLVLLLKRATLFPAASTKEINLILFGFNVIAFLFFSRNNMREYFTNLRTRKAFFLWVLAAAGFSFLGNYVSILALDAAPNAGYHEAIKNTNVLFVTLISILLIPRTFEKYKIFGVCLVTIGILVLVLH